jgi:hypothetical protein
MRKITREIAEAFIDGRSLRIDNSETDGMSLWLHGNLIARKDGECIVMTLAGWPTPTTRERLNGVCELVDGSRPFFQRDNEQFFDYSPISSDWTVIWNPVSRDKWITLQPIREYLDQ